MNHNDPVEALQRKQGVAGLFHRASATYDHVGPNFFSYFGRRLVEHAALPPNAHVLDVASGRGAVLFPAAEAVGPGGSVIGIDFAEGMVKEVTREARQRGLSNVDVRQMDAEHLEFPDVSFDVILCGFGIFFFPQVKLALAEFLRTLQPGGRIAVTTWSTQFEQEREWFYALIEKYLPARPEVGGRSTQPDAPDFGTPAGMENLFNAAGFADVRVISETVDFSYASREEWWQSLWSHGSRRSLERIKQIGGAERLAQFKAECFEQIDAMISTQEFRQPFPVLYTLAIKPA